MKCRNCGAEGDGKYCEHCGTPLADQAVKDQVPAQPWVNIAAPPVQPAVNPAPPQSHPVVNFAPPMPAGKPKKQFYKKWWFWVIIAVAVIIIAMIASSIGNGGNKGTQSSTNSSAQSKVSKSSSSAASAKVYKDGTYLVGKDIEAGLYRATLTDTVTKMGYIERSKGVSMDADDILANVILTGNGYVEIKSTDTAVKLQGVEITKIDISTLPKAPKAVVTDGMYLVGYDLAPGTYKVEVTDTVTKMGYVERVKSASMDSDDIIDNAVIDGPGYVEVKATDFAVFVQGAKLTLQK
jgi:uncharacterized protein with FMN-binding domain